jgi:hypothetical protein
MPQEEKDTREARLRLMRQVSRLTAFIGVNTSGDMVADAVLEVLNDVELLFPGELQAARVRRNKKTLEQTLHRLSMPPGENVRKAIGVV